MLVQRAESLETIFSGDDGDAVKPQKRLDHLPRIRVILDHEHRPTCHEW